MGADSPTLKQVNIRLPESLADDLQRLAGKCYVSRQELIRQYLVLAVNEAKEKGEL